MPKTFSILSVVRYIGDRANHTTLYHEAERLAYIANMISLGDLDRPMVGGLFRAWEYGPRHMELQDWIKKRDISMLYPTSIDRNELDRNITDPEFKKLIYQVVDRLWVQGDNSRNERLIAITNWDKGAWCKCVNKRQKNPFIPNHLLKE